MNITEVRVFIADEEDERLKAYATITLENCFVVRDLKVIYGNAGLFVAMPSKKRKDGTYKDIAHPINKDFRTMVEERVLEAYQEETKSFEAGVSTTRSDDADVPAGEASPSAYSQVRAAQAGVGPGSADE